MANEQDYKRLGFYNDDIKSVSNSFSENKLVTTITKQDDTTIIAAAADLPGFMEYDNLNLFPEKGEAGKIYVAKDTNLTYRWSETAYIEISPSLALGETNSTAYAGDKGKKNAENIAANAKNIATNTGNIATNTGNITKIINGISPVGKVANKLTVTGAASGTYDGSAPVTINIPTIAGPKGDTGPQGPAGQNGTAAGVGVPTVDNTAANNVGTAAVEVTATGPNTAKVFNFKFKNLKGATGAQGPAGAAGGTGPQGPRGYGVGSVSKKSGSTASGQTAVYSVKQETTGTEIGTFNVYNGKDGTNGTNGKDGGQGPRGERGPQGYSIGSVTGSLVSGDEAVSTYTLHLNDSAGTALSVPIKVKNGSKGSTGGDGPQGPRGPVGPQGPRGFDVKTIVANGQDSAGGNIYRMKDSNGSYLENTFIAPKGEKGESIKGDPGVPGAAAGFGTPTVDDSKAGTVGTPNVEVTASGPNTAKVFNFKFENLKGQKGDSIKGDPGTPAGFGNPTVDNTLANNVGTAAVDVTASGPNTAKVFNFKFKNLKGQKGDKGDSITGPTGPEGRGIKDVTLKSGTHAAGTTDTYKITYTKGIPAENTFTVWNGSNGADSTVPGPKGDTGDTYVPSIDYEGYLSWTRQNKPTSTPERQKIRGSKWHSGTAVPKDQDQTQDYLPSDMYLRTTTNDVYQMNGSGYWHVVSNIKGDPGTTKYSELTGAPDYSAVSGRLNVNILNATTVNAASTLNLGENDINNLFLGKSAAAAKVANKLTFTGASTGTYDGSAPLTINIPSGGSSGSTVSPNPTVTYSNTELKSLGVNGTNYKIGRKLVASQTLNMELVGPSSGPDEFIAPARLKTITLSNSIQSGDLVKIYFIGNEAYTSSEAGMISFEASSLSNKGIRGGGMTVLVGGVHAIVYADIGTNSAWTTNKINVYNKVFDISYGAPADARKMIVQKVEIWR